MHFILFFLSFWMTDLFSHVLKVFCVRFCQHFHVHIASVNCRSLSSFFKKKHSHSSIYLCSQIHFSPQSFCIDSILMTLHFSKFCFWSRIIVIQRSWRKQKHPIHQRSNRVTVIKVISIICSWMRTKTVRKITVLIAENRQLSQYIADSHSSCSKEKHKRTKQTAEAIKRTGQTEGVQSGKIGIGADMFSIVDCDERPHYTTTTYN